MHICALRFTTGNEIGARARIEARRARASSLTHLGVQGSLCFDQLLLFQREARLFFNHVSHLQA